MDAPYLSASKFDPETKLVGKVALCALVLNLGLAVVKGFLAVVTGSLAVTAGAIDSATDAAASLVLFGGLKLSVKKTPSFPLGLYKIENLISVFVAFSIFFAGYEIAHKVLAGVSGPPQVSLLAIVLLFAGAAATFSFGSYALAVGRQTESPTLMAEGRHRQVDVLSSVVVLVAVSLEYLEWRISFYGISIDQIAAGLVLIFIVKAGWELLTDGMRVLLDASLDFEALDQVRSVLNEHPLVAKVRSLVGRNAGRFRFLQTNIVVRTVDLQKAHRISQDLEREIRRKVPHLERVIIHYEPQPRTHLRIAAPLADSNGKMSDHFGSSPYFALVTVRLSDRYIEEEEVIDNPHRDVETAKGIRVAEWLIGQDVDQVMMNEDLSRKGPGYALSNAGVQMTVTSTRTLREAIDETLSAIANPQDTASRIYP